MGRLPPLVEIPSGISKISVLWPLKHLIFMSKRVWVHVEGDQTPFFDGDGFVVGTDQARRAVFFGKRKTLVIY